MYVGYGDLEHLQSFLTGYHMGARFDVGSGDELSKFANEFWDFVDKRYGDGRNNRTWSQIIIEQCEGNAREDSFSMFFKLVSEFFGHDLNLAEPLRD